MSYIQVETDERDVTTLSLNRPDSFNALNRSMIDELTNTLETLNSNTRLLILSGQGKHFCSGADIQWMRASQSLSTEENQADAMAFSNMLDTLNSLPIPTIAKIHGYALGGGTGLACCCDMVVADETSKFAFSEVRLGIIPATISPYSLGAIGARAARRYFLTGETIDAVEAYRIGLIHDVCSHDNLSVRVEELVSHLLNSGSNAQREAKLLIKDVTTREINTPLREMLAHRLAKIRTTDEAQEGLSAFLEKRPASWKQ